MASQIPFELVSRYKNAFQKQAGKDAVNTKLSRAEIERKGTIAIEALPEMFKAINFTLPEEELEVVRTHLLRERQHAIETGCKPVPGPDLGPGRVSFNDFCWVMTHSEFRFALLTKETLAATREQAITEYVRKLLNHDEPVRAAALRDPPGSLMGDKQAVRVLASHMHNLINHADVRVACARGISAIAEKPREASGVNKQGYGGRQAIIYDNKALSAFRHTLEYGEAQAYFDIRTFRNREPDQPPVELEPDLIAAYKASAHADKIVIVHELSTERPQENLYLHPVKLPRNEPSDPVRIAAVLGIYGVADTENEVAIAILLKVLALDPGWAVRAAALEVLRLWAADARKEGPLMRLGNAARWFPEEYYPWRSREEAREHFWTSLLDACANDPAWQVRKRCVVTLAEAVDMGNERVYAGLVASLEDPSQATRICAFKCLTAALFARGSFVSERNHRVQVHIHEGMRKWDACVLASQEAAQRRGEVDAELCVIKALVDRSKSESAVTRRAAVTALGSVTQRAQLRGDALCMEALLNIVEKEPDPAVQRAAVLAMSRAGIEGEEVVLGALKKTALSHKDRDVRKGAVEALEKLAYQGDTTVIEALAQCLKDPHAEVREAAVRALERAAEEGHPGAVEAAEGMLKDKSWFVRRAAARSTTMLEPEGERQSAVSSKILGREDKNWYAEVQAYLTKPLFYQSDTGAEVHWDCGLDSRFVDKNWYAEVQAYLTKPLFYQSDTGAEVHWDCGLDSRFVDKNWYAEVQAYL
eukprot:CAMPEP_0206263680 /NCGR_PEP_ID=MMETSP0047_2-20121206/28963_1 /ASSEMBLY_ACC=CAM_ASM_000192 /TAXON_ID=195065 /ORGANISM="Chroomonas mesostigmatica_cf, Strain CCMP1168" /LENGTH=760 /DNA_ID=CAMNT_0053691269 /DNA_START=60 /DNA_END=2340 /DNA_ORIENTATION=-